MTLVRVSRWVSKLRSWQSRTSTCGACSSAGKHLENQPPKVHRRKKIEKKIEKKNKNNKTLFAGRDPNVSLRLYCLLLSLSRIRSKTLFCRAGVAVADAVVCLAASLSLFYVCLAESKNSETEIAR